MLLYKGWLESRFRFLASLAMAAFFLLSAYSFVPVEVAKAPAAVKGLLMPEWIIVAMFAGLVAGAGITTQPALQATKGLHGSMLFTLSLPVSRFRLLAVRASLGWVEMVAGIAILCAGMWTLFPILRAATSPQEMFQYWAVLVVCATGLYSVPVLLATFLDDQGRLFGNFIVLGALFWLSNHLGLPNAWNLFRAMGEGSPVLAHSIPWTAMGCWLGLAVSLFLAAAKIVQRREY